MYYSEMKQAVKLLANEWNLGKKECGATGNICAWIYHLQYQKKAKKLLLIRMEENQLDLVDIQKIILKNIY